jgi:nitric oxide reductase subunit B
VLFQKSDILAGQDVYQRYGLMDHGSVWGHGSQRGPEFSATTLHLLGTAARNNLVRREFRKPYEDLDSLQKEIADLKISRELKTNRYDQRNDTLTLTPGQVQALGIIHQHWEKTFRNGEFRYRRHARGVAPNFSFFLLDSLSGIHQSEGSSPESRVFLFSCSL